jgi:hypothetical protein
MAQKKIKGIETIPFGGGADIRHQNEPVLIPSGGYSALQNMRNIHPGLKQRPGCVKQHMTADSTNKVMSMYQFVKGKKTERHFFAQMSDSDVLEATNAPPTITPEVMTLDVSPATDWAAGDIITGQTSGKTCTIVAKLSATTYSVLYRNGAYTLDEVVGVTGTAAKLANQGATRPVFSGGEFGAEVFSGSANPVPASWDNINDFMLFCNGVDVPQIYPGTGQYVESFYVYKGSFDPLTTTAATGVDYSTEVSDGDSTTYADISNLTVVAETLGNEIVVNGTFTADSDWTPFGAATIGGGLLTLTDTSSATQDVTINVGNHYKLTTDIAVISGTPSVKIGPLGYYDYVGPYTTAGTKTGYFTAFNNSISIYNQAVAGVATVDNLSIKETIHHCLFVRTPLPVQSLAFVLSAFNGAAAVANVKYWDGDSFTDVSGFSDGTFSVASTFSKDGSMSWIAPSDEQETNLYAQNAYWYMIYLSSGTLDSTTRISSVTYESSWQSIKNLWDGVYVECVEAFMEASGVLSSFTGSEITLSNMGATSALYFASYDDIDSIKITLEGGSGETTGAVISLYRWISGAWEQVTITDKTDGFSNPARILFPRITSDIQTFNQTGYMAHWYKITVNVTLPSYLVIGLYVQPYFDIADIGKGMTVATFNGQVFYGTDQDNIVYVSAPNAPQVLNGDNSIIFSVGDGRLNRPVAMRKVGNNLLIWQEEKGKDGGCVTVLENTGASYSSTTAVSSAVISSTLGAMSNKAVDVVDGLEFAELNRDIPVMTVAFCLSRSGVYVTSGSVCYMISKDIANYFDPTDSTCIRTGYEKDMWLKYDSAFGVIRVGLVSGSSATVPNVFPVYDIKTKTWSVDSLAQEFSCMTEVEAGSGSIPILQIGGGTDDGMVYISNSGKNDVSTAIDSYATIELDGLGNQLCMDDLLIRMKTQSSGYITVTPSLNGIASTSFTLDQTAELSNQKHRRHRKGVNLISDHISLKVQHNTISEDCYLLDHGESLSVYGEQ